MRDVFYLGKKPNVHPREKYISSIEDAREQCTTEHFWIINEFCDYRGFDWEFDFEFLPDSDVWAENHNNIWPSLYQKDSGTWLCSKEQSDILIYRGDVDPLKRKNEKNANWVILDLIDETRFDFGWHPDPTDSPYIYKWGCKFLPVEFRSCVEYHVPGAIEVKYMREIVDVLPEWDRWTISEDIDKTSFDFSWRPNPKSPPYIYVWGNKWNKPEVEVCIQYTVSGAIEVKYMREIVDVLPEWDRWTISEDIDKTSFDFSWRPNPKSPPYIYAWGNQWNKPEVKVSVQYTVTGAIEYKFMPDPIMKKPSMDNWIIPDGILSNEFDFSWEPNPNDLPLIYQFGTQWQKTGGPKYISPKADENTLIKYIDVIKAKRLPNKERWEIPNDIDIDDFDFSWYPDELAPDYIYQFGTQWQKTGGPKYIPINSDENTLIKYIDVIKAKRLPNTEHWEIPNDIDIDDFDFSWHHNELAPKYIYQFGTLADKNDGPKYVLPDNTGEIVYLDRAELKEEVQNFNRYVIETTLDNLVTKHPTEIFWALNPDLDYSAFDFNWRPNIEQAQYIHAFGSKESMNTQTYFVNGHTYMQGFKEINYVQEKTIEVKTNIDMFFVDRGNPESQDRFDKLKSIFNNIHKTRYLNSWVDTINRCINKSTSNLCWILNSELDYTDFDFNYYPNPWQIKMTHVFGTQWSHWGTTFMVNRETFANDTKYINIIEHLSNLNFVRQRTAKATNVLHDVIYIDHGNMDMSSLAHEGRLIVKYENSYLETFKKMLAQLPDKKEHFVWAISTICNYGNFDLTYICDPFSKDQLHVFPSDRQKFGDTFLININKLRELIGDMKTLQDYGKINFNQHQRAVRFLAPVIVSDDTHLSNINTDFDFPYAVFVTEDNKEINAIDLEPMNLWSTDTKTIQVTSTGGTRIIVPKEVKNHVKRELYDYPYISKNAKLIKSSPMDIVFLSNGETGADENFNQLQRVTAGLANRVVRVDGVKGRVAAYHAAAKASNTPWLFTVFAKLRVNSGFDWSWQPDRLQLPKHYIFQAKNPVNGLVYGHQAMIAYNKKLTLANIGKGLDFTMDDEHEVVDMLSGIASFNTDEWNTWRTAFREALKLRNDIDNEVSKTRLDTWLTVGDGAFAQYSIDGAKHAVEYYEEVDGDFEKLKLSYDWPWLQAKFDEQYK